MGAVIRNRYEPVVEARCDFVPSGESMTKQSFAYDADINVIVGKYLESPDPRIFNENPGRYGDVTDFGDFQRCMENVKAAEQAFRSLPAVVRDHFANDAGRLLEAVFDPAREAELRELGLLLPKEAVAKAAEPAKEAVSS